jgi:hypothetical protein
METRINFTGKNYNRSGLGFFHTFNDSTCVTWSEKDDIKDLLSGQCPQITGFVKDTIARRD